MARTAARKRRRQRNRRPPPFRPDFGTAPIEIIDAWAPDANTNTVVILFSKPMQLVAAPPGAEWQDFTEAQAVGGIVNADNGTLWPQFQGRILALAFGSSVNRIGHEVGWDAVPTNLSGLGVPFVQNSTFVVRIGAIA